MELDIEVGGRAQISRGGLKDRKHGGVGWGGVGWGGGGGGGNRTMCIQQDDQQHIHLRRQGTGLLVVVLWLWD
jgi:hypothetical protein